MTKSNSLAPYATDYKSNVQFYPPHVANGSIKGVKDIVATLKAVRDFVSRAVFLYMFESGYKGIARG